MIPQLIKQAQALLIFLQDSAVFTTSEDGHTYRLIDGSKTSPFRAILDDRYTL
jgi:hypothetical protein